MTAADFFQRDHCVLIKSRSSAESSKRRRAQFRRLLEIAAASLLLVACAPTPIFPPEVIEKVDRSITFKEVVAHPAEYEGRVVELGGEILGSVIDGEEVQLLIRELPIRTTPVYGPFDPGGPRGMFVIRYTGKVGAQDIQSSNLIVVIGTMIGATLTNLTGAPVRRPTVSAECFHVWRTQGNPIDDFPWIMNTRYWRLIEQTYCINRPNTILYVTWSTVQSKARTGIAVSLSSQRR